MPSLISRAFRQRGSARAKRRSSSYFPEDSLWEVYGSTELGVNAILEPGDQRRKRGSCGRPAPTVELKLFDDDGVEVTEPGVPGELFVRSKTVFDTYYEPLYRYIYHQIRHAATAEDLTAETFSRLLQAITRWRATRYSVTLISTTLKTVSRRPSN